jgi:hypothetical protein
MDPRHRLLGERWPPADAVDQRIILGFAAFGPEAGELMANVQVAMLARQPYTLLRDVMFTSPDNE